VGGLRVRRLVCHSGRTVTHDSQVAEDGTSVSYPSTACIVPVVLRTMHQYGNSSSATIPIAITEGVESGRVHRDNILLLTAVGVGTLSAGLVIRW